MSSLRSSDPVQNCTLMNITQHSFRLECMEGSNGGLRQHFVMEVHDATASPAREPHRRHPRLPRQGPTSPHRIRSGGVRGERQGKEPGSSAQGQHAEH
ncbi:hypothetical protein CEXT_332551 [Caerostris extrusa]|uniref:Uncharacterized protein n=1 Tax=Caerostris extrusa TaxID=172846 RepID=A0AAV4TS36_CAEEX|nr:hypothetical protein CEXT_332551 [Caerostris extrusa]